MREIEKYPDESDRATAIEEAAIETALQMIRNKASETELKATGFCLNCDAKLEEGKRFCDKDCLDDYDRRTRKKDN